MRWKFKRNEQSKRSELDDEKTKIDCSFTGVNEVFEFFNICFTLEVFELRAQCDKIGARMKKILVC